MKCLVVVAHPLENSLCKHLADNAISALRAKGYQVIVKDLYAEGFSPVLSKEERQSYYQPAFDRSRLESDIAQLTTAESLILIFPTWWFSFPAILKGWFDRVWAPGHAYDHATDFGPIKPRLANLKEVSVITTLGSPWWVDTFVLRKPVKRLIKLALLGTCAPKCAFKMFTLYNSEQLNESNVAKFVGRIQAKL